MNKPKKAAAKVAAKNRIGKPDGQHARTASDSSRDRTAPPSGRPATPSGADAGGAPQATESRSAPAVEKIKVSSGADLLAYIPHVVGYWPANSVVCLGMSGARVRATMRLDLPSSAGSDPMGYAQAAAAHLRTDADADGSLIAFFGTSDWTIPSQNPQGRLFTAMVQAFGDVGLPVRDAWYVGRDHWRHVGCRDADCCGWPGQDVARIVGSRLNAELIYRGSSVGANPYERIPRLVEPEDAARVGQVGAVADELRGALAAGGSGTPQLCVILAVWERALFQDPADLDAAMAGFLVASLTHVGVRDTVLVAMADGVAPALNGAVGAGVARPGFGTPVLPAGWSDDAQALPATVPPPRADLSQAAEDYADILMGGRSGTGPVPDWNRLDRAEELLLVLARSTLGPDKAPVLCMLGWIQWCRGRGTWAGVYFTLSQECRPGYRLAALLEQLLDAGCIAGWAKNEATAWRGGRRLGDVA